MKLAELLRGLTEGCSNGTGEIGIDRTYTGTHTQVYMHFGPRTALYFGGHLILT